MHPPNHRPTETFLGAMYEREDLLRQEAQNSRMARRVRTIAKVAFVLMVVGIVAAIAVGPGRAIDWLVNDLMPVAVITGVIIAAFALLLYAYKRLPESPLRDWYQ